MNCVHMLELVISKKFGQILSIFIRMAGKVLHAHSSEQFVMNGASIQLRLSHCL